MGNLFPETQKIFDTFVVNKSNQFAMTVAKCSADLLFKEYRHFAIYCPTFSGKSHLLHAFANRAMTTSPQVRPMLITAADFPEMLGCSTKSMATSGVGLFCIENLEEIIEMPEPWDWLTESLCYINKAGGHVALTCNLNKVDRNIFY